MIVAQLRFPRLLFLSTGGSHVDEATQPCIPDGRAHHPSKEAVGFIGRLGGREV